MAKRICSVCGKTMSSIKWWAKTADDKIVCQQCLADSELPSVLSGMTVIVSADSDTIKKAAEENRRKGITHKRTDVRTEALKPNVAKKDDDVIRCPKCGSTQITANQKGFGAGKALAGAVVAGPIGLIGGAMGSNKIIITCLSCGHRFKPGQGR